MKVLEIIAAASLIKSALAQRFTFCGGEPCLIPLNQFSCEYMIQNYEFLGSCCRLVDIPATGGCRVEVGFNPGVDRANCAWVPRCESCDPNAGDQCGWEYQTASSTYQCPDEGTYDALAIQQAWKETPSPSESASNAPTPTFFVEDPISCEPTAAPVAVEVANASRSSSLSAIVSLSATAATAFYFMS